MNVFRVEGYIYDDFQKDNFSDKVEYAYLYVSTVATSRNKVANGLKTSTYKVDVSVADEIFSNLERNDFVELYFSTNSENAKVSFVRKVDFDSLDDETKEQFLTAIENDFSFIEEHL